MRPMKTLLASLLLAVSVCAQAQPRLFSQAELDALLAPIALYPDPLLSQVLIAATYPDDVREAAAWSRANRHLQGEEAVRAADPIAWDPSLKALLAYPDLLARMDESPQWTADLGAAFLAQEPQVMETVQDLRRRAQASGYLQSDAYQSVQDHGSYIVVQPVHSHVVYLPWYNPVVVYGPWWWHSHRPIAWRPWRPRPASFISLNFAYPSVDWHRRHVTRTHVHRPVRDVHRPVRAHPPAPVIRPHPAHQAPRARPIVQGAQLPPKVGGHEQRSLFQKEPRPAQAQTYAQQAERALMAPRVGEVRKAHPSDFRREHRSDDRRQHRAESRQPRVHSQGRGRGRD